MWRAGNDVGDAVSETAASDAASLDSRIAFSSNRLRMERGAGEAVGGSVTGEPLDGVRTLAVAELVRSVVILERLDIDLATVL